MIDVSNSLETYLAKIKWPDLIEPIIFVFHFNHFVLALEENALYNITDLIPPEHPTRIISPSTIFQLKNPYVLRGDSDAYINGVDGENHIPWEFCDRKKYYENSILEKFATSSDKWKDKRTKNLEIFNKAKNDKFFEARMLIIYNFIGENINHIKDIVLNTDVPIGMKENDFRQIFKNLKDKRSKAPVGFFDHKKYEELGDTDCPGTVDYVYEQYNQGYYKPLLSSSQKFLHILFEIFNDKIFEIEHQIKKLIKTNKGKCRIQ